MAQKRKPNTLIAFFVVCLIAIAAAFYKANKKLYIQENPSYVGNSINLDSLAMIALSSKNKNPAQLTSYNRSYVYNVRDSVYTYSCRIRDGKTVKNILLKLKYKGGDFNNPNNFKQIDFQSNFVY